MKILCRGEKSYTIPRDKIITQREWKSCLNQIEKKNPIMEGFKYLEYLEEIPGSTYKDVALKFDISKARVSQMIALVTRLPKEIIDFLISKNEPEYLRYFTERRLRPLTLLDSDEEKVERFSGMVEDPSIYSVS